MIGVQTREHANHVRVVRSLGQQRCQHVVGRGQIAGLAQRIGLAQDVARAQVVERAPLLRRHRHFLQLAQHACQLHVLLRFQQRCRVLQSQAGAGLRCARQHLAHHAEGAMGIARIGIGEHHRAEQFGVLPHERLGLRQHRHGLLRMPLLAQSGGGVGLHVHPHAALQRGDVACAVLFGDAVQRLHGTGPVARFGCQQRAGVQSFGHVGVGHQQTIHDAARFTRCAKAQIQPRQIEAHPRIAGIAQQRVLQRDTRRVVVAALHGLACLAHGLRSAQTAQRPDLFLLLGRELFHQLERITRLACLRQHTRQTANGVRVVLLACQHPAVCGLGSIQLALLGEHVGQRVFGGDFLGIDLDRLLQHLARAGQIARLLRIPRLLHQRPIGGAAQGLLPAARRTLPGCALQIVARLHEFFLAQTHQPHTAQRIAIVGTRFEHAAEIGLCRFQIAIVQRLEALHAAQAQRIACSSGGHLRGALARFDLAQPRLHGLIVGVDAQVGLIHRNVRRTATAHPRQRLAPALDGRLAYGGVTGQTRQLRNALAARGLTVSEVLRERERDLRVVRSLAREAFQSLACLLPTGARATQRLIVLQRQRASGRSAAQCGLITAHGLLGLPGLRLCTRLLQLCRVALCGQILLQSRHQSVLRVGRAQLVQIPLGFCAVVGLDLRARHAVQRIGLVGLGAQQTLPGLDGALAVATRLPVLALLDQCLGGGVLRLYQRAAK